MINTSEVIETVADKIQTAQRLAAKGFPIPRTVLSKFPVNTNLIEEKLGFPARDQDFARNTRWWRISGPD